MVNDLRSLRLESPRRVDVPIVAGLALALLVFGVTRPALTFDNLFLVGDETFSVVSGIWSFATSGNILLALLLFGFSVAFPAIKLGGILVLWFVPTREPTRVEIVDWLELLGKWSLLDAFVIAVLVGTVQLGLLSQAAALPGAYVYLASILLSLVAILLLSAIVRSRRRQPRRPFTRRGLWLTVPAAVLYGAGLSLPLLDVEKGFFWGNRYSLLRGVGQLLQRGDWVLGSTLLLFVVVLPTLRLLALFVLRLVRPQHAKWRERLLLLDGLSMLDVFVLALLVVFTKLDALASPTPLAGMWLLVAAAAVSVLDSVLLHRGARWRPARG
ncbi:MAG TPA: paraquat-inducible protein A [Planctomycetota bacterium]|nr:paraquat-inducible protein A [Planctomycetota bacterium]